MYILVKRRRKVDRDAVKRMAFTSFMDPVCPVSGRLSYRGFFSRSTPAVRGVDSSSSGYSARDSLQMAVCERQFALTLHCRRPWGRGGYSGTKPAQETCFVGEARPGVGYLRRRRSCSSHPPDTAQACAWCLSNSRLLFARCTCRPNLRVLQAMVRPLCTVARTVVEGVARQLGSRDWSCNRWGCGKGGGTWRHLPASDG